MFIPIDAKADITGSKKGKLTPAQHAQLNAWCLAEKTGILDCLGRCEAEQLTYTATNNIATIVFKRGYVVICGRLVECEAGTQVQINTPATGSVTGKIILKYNLSASEEGEFVVTTKESALTQQDLNDNPITGVYEFELYSYTATPYLVTLKARTIPYVPDIGGKLSQFEASLKDEGKPLHGYDDTKGTIEERLTRLGFKRGALLNMPSGASGWIYKLGHFVYGNILYSGTAKKLTDNTTLFNIPSDFMPYGTPSCDYGIRYVAGQSMTNGTMKVYFSGNRAYVHSGGQSTVTQFDILFGWSTVDINSLG